MDVELEYEVERPCGQAKFLPTPAALTAAVAAPLCPQRALVRDWGGVQNRHHETQHRLCWLMLNNLLYLLAAGS